MTATALEGVLRRDRAVILGAVAVVVALAWTYLLSLAGRMGAAHPDMDMSGVMDMPGMLAPAVAGWSAPDFLFVLAMWIVMMIGMMLPSVTPMLLIYAGVARQAQDRGKPFASTGWFAGGYLLAWIGFSLAATSSQWGLERAALLSPVTMTVARPLGGVLLILAGLYQFTPLKAACLSVCQAPLVFIQRHGGFRREPGHSLWLGASHGLYCIGCCWALMTLLFVGGIMNPLWIAALSVFVLIEKIARARRVPSLVSGTAMIAAGLWLLL
ncbi:MAG: putative metal-binding integral rane protein [Rhizobiaceae bacterium]|jgi:predicted metal-binding membrane protein|nr:putative metal-binding integral rane protein [Rhizobiaceae bacterium]